jgi:hypothetical protein
VQDGCADAVLSDVDAETLRPREALAPRIVGAPRYDPVPFDLSLESVLVDGFVALMVAFCMEGLCGCVLR